ncbi:hypothetical protein N008_13620 [Hymenobacter sp. APR13]|nr:hypothetical protein N008_13620 [Hymenobacter sp. APR13]
MYDSHYLQVAIDVQNSWLYACWLGEIAQADLYKGVEVIVRIAQENGLSKLLNDNRYLTALRVTPADWYRSNGLKQLYTNGLHYVAWIYAPDMHARAMADGAMTKNIWPLTLTFEEYDVAVDWLRSMP